MKNIQFSYPKTERDLNTALRNLHFNSTELGTAYQNYSFEVGGLDESLWVDINFFAICQAISVVNEAWSVAILEPSHSYYQKLYSVLPIVFSSDIRNEKDYYELIHKPIGESNADAIAYVWEVCGVFGTSGKWAFRFDRGHESGTFFSKAPGLPRELRKLL